MTFLRPWFLLLLLVPFIFGLFRERLATATNWTKVIDERLLPYLLIKGTNASAKQRSIFRVLLWILFSFAAAGPAWNKIPMPSRVEYPSTVIVLEVNRAMSGPLLDQAKRKIQDILTALKGEQVALVLYDQYGYTAGPLTFETDIIREMLPHINNNLLPRPGSDPLVGFQQADQLLQNANIPVGRILFITTGAIVPDELEQTIKELPHKIGILGIGSSVPRPIPLPEGGFLKDKDGKPIMLQLDPQKLSKFGVYQSATPDDKDIQYLIQNTRPNPDESEHEIIDSKPLWEDMGAWFVVIGLPLFALLFRRGLLMLLLLISVSAQASLWRRPDQEEYDQQMEAVSQYRHGDYTSAEFTFKSGTHNDDIYNQGNALAAQHKFQEAIATYKKVLERDPKHEDARYNKEYLEKLLEEEKKQEEKKQQEKEQQQKEEERKKKEEQLKQQLNQLKNLLDKEKQLQEQQQKEVKEEQKQDEQKRQEQLEKELQQQQQEKEEQKEKQEQLEQQLNNLKDLLHQEQKLQEQQQEEVENRQKEIEQDKKSVPDKQQPENKQQQEKENVTEKQKAENQDSDPSKEQEQQQKENHEKSNPDMEKQSSEKLEQSQLLGSLANKIADDIQKNKLHQQQLDSLLKDDPVQQQETLQQMSETIHKQVESSTTEEKIDMVKNEPELQKKLPDLIKKESDLKQKQVNLIQDILQRMENKPPQQEKEQNTPSQKEQAKPEQGPEVEQSQEQPRPLEELSKRIADDIQRNETHQKELGNIPKYNSAERQEALQEISDTLQDQLDQSSVKDKIDLAEDKPHLQKKLSELVKRENDIKKQQLGIIQEIIDQNNPPQQQEYTNQTPPIGTDSQSTPKEDQSSEQQPPANSFQESDAEVDTPAQQNFSGDEKGSVTTEFQPSMQQVKKEEKEIFSPEEQKILNHLENDQEGVLRYRIRQQYLKRIGKSS